MTQTASELNNLLLLKDSEMAAKQSKVIAAVLDKFDFEFVKKIYGVSEVGDKGYGEIFVSLLEVCVRACNNKSDFGRGYFYCKYTESKDDVILDVKFVPEYVWVNTGYLKND